MPETEPAVFTFPTMRNLSKEERKLYEKLATVTTFNPREEQ